MFFLSEYNDISNVSPADAVTLHLSSMPSGYLSPSSDRIRQVSISTFDARVHVHPVFEKFALYGRLIQKLNFHKRYTHHRINVDLHRIMLHKDQIQFSFSFTSFNTFSLAHSCPLISFSPFLLKINHKVSHLQDASTM